MQEFNSYQLNQHIQTALQGLGFVTPTEIQKQVFEHLLSNPAQDFHGQASTGTGKTLAFGIPLFQAIDVADRATQGLIVAPTRELVMQICESLQAVAKDSGIVIRSVYGGVSIVPQIRDLRSGAHIVVGTPGRIIDHLERSTLSLAKTRIVVLDEADIMLDMGFREEIDSILKRVAADRSLWLFSATVKDGVLDIKNRYMKNVVSVSVKAQASTAALTRQWHCLVSRKNRLRALARFLDVEPDFYGIIFCSTKLQCAEVAQELGKRGYTAMALHGDMDQPLRSHVIECFKREKKNSILVATDVAARGIDVADLTHVINYSVPEDYECYVHRIGRTGRAGKQGTAITFVAPSEQHRLRTIARRFNLTIDPITIPSDERVAAARVENLFKRAQRDGSKTSGACAEFIKSLLHERSPEELIAGLVHVLCDEVTQDMPAEEPMRFDDTRGERGERGGRRGGSRERSGGRERGERGGGRREGRREERREFGGARRGERSGSDRGPRRERSGERGERPQRGGGDFQRGGDFKRGGDFRQRSGGDFQRDGGSGEYRRSGGDFQRDGGSGEYRRGGDRQRGGSQVMLTVGSDDKVNKQDILRALQSSGAELNALGPIRVIARRTFIGADATTCNALAKVLDGAMIEGHRVRAKVEGS